MLRRSSALALAPLLSVCLSSFAPRPAAAGDSLDVADWLRRPGVKLVAVELYATWCKPCMAAVPRWKALHERYADEGLRLIVVSTQDPGGACVNPGWNPDEVVCDDEGTVARALGAGDQLPAAFLWSWQGRLLVQRGHVDGVEAEIERWMRATPRVSVEVPEVAPSAGIDAAGLRDLVRERVRDEGKLYVIATKEEQAKLDRLKAESLKGRYDERFQCDIGKELPANSLLEARLRDGAKKMLVLSLLSVEKGCLVAAATVPFGAGRARVVVAEALAELMAKLRVPFEAPRGAAVAGAPKSAAATGDDYADFAREIEAGEKQRKKMEDAWAIVQKAVASDVIDRPRKRALLERFKGDFPDKNPHLSEVERMLPALSDAPPEKPPEPARPAPSASQAISVASERIEITEQIAFETAKAKIKPVSDRVLGSLAEVLKSNPAMRIRIEGHSDSMGSDTANLKLTQERAEAVRTWLIERAGIAASRLEAIGYGETKPIASNQTAQGRAQNRRVEFHVIAK